MLAVEVDVRPSQPGCRTPSSDGNRSTSKLPCVALTRCESSLGRLKAPSIRLAQSDRSSAVTHRTGKAGLPEGARRGTSGPTTAPVSRNRISAPSSASRMACALFAIGVRRPRSKSATVEVATPAALARSCCDHANSARAARTCFGVRLSGGEKSFMSCKLYDFGQSIQNVP